MSIKGLILTTKCRSRASALVFVLAAVALMSVLVLAFFTHATLSRQTSFSSGGMARANAIALSGMDTIIGDLLSEISAGSSVRTTNGISIYLPITNLSVAPYRVGDQGLPNLLKQSTSFSNIWAGSSYAKQGPVRAAAGNSTLNSSANGRKINVVRWNAHYLLGETVSTNYTPPDWILVTRQGAVTNASLLPAMSVLADPSPSNPNFVLGRFSYAVYDEGGLLDINLAGGPSTMPPDFKTRRGFLQQVDLGKIPGILDADSVVKWRNAATATNAALYSQNVFSNANGFTSVYPGDQTFLSRQDLIQYVNDHPAEIETRALQYLGTFSREKNAPTYTPKSTRARILASENSVLYGMDDQFNPSLMDVRDSTGNSLIKQRFPLSRLALITPDATADETSDIYRYFGLTRASASSPWVYNHGDPAKIYKLSEVAELGRQPDFFELLQAAISVGSLAKTSGSSYSDTRSYDQNLYYHIVQIAANAIDQYDADSFPTRIIFNGTEIYGVENLPYLAQVYETPFRPAGGNRVATWYQPVVWNPHANAGSVSSAPSRFRFVSKGYAYSFFLVDPAPPYISYPPRDLEAGGGIEFTNNPAFVRPTLLTPEVGADAAGDNKVAYDSSRFLLGICLGYADFPPKDENGNFQSSSSYTVAQPAVSHELQYWDGSQWITYSQMKNVVDRAPHTSPDSFTTYTPSCYEIRSDPRTDRFGVFGSYDPSNAANRMAAFSRTIRPDAGDGEQAHVGVSAHPGWSYGGAQPYGNTSVYVGTLSDNTASSATHYADSDGTQRRADGAYSGGGDLDGRPLATDNFPSRPLVLNRPFRSVADLGYVSRGVPWKSLDFFTAESGDAALLDVFCMNESSDPFVEHGRVNLNTRQAPVLSAVLAGAIKSDGDETVISDADSAALGSSLVAMTSDPQKGPLENRSDLVTRWAGLLDFGASSDNLIKRRREAAVRTLADVGNVRTWNLMIDVIAQSGRFAKNAQDVNAFIVEGEKRYWLHIAIDRYTGEVLGKQLENIYE